MTGPDLAELYASLVDADPVELLEPLVEASGGRLVEAVREDVVYRPASSASVRFAATVERDGSAGREGWVVHAADPLPPGVLVLDGPAGPVAAWRVRDDPRLPGLRAALDRGAVTALLADLGLPTDGVTLELLAYRPQRRAVVSVTTPGHRLFVKCLRPDRVGALHARHVACREAGLPVPRAVGYDQQLGLLLLTPLRGEPLRDSLLRADGVLPAPDELAALLERFAAVSLDVPARAPVRQAAGHAALLRAVVPTAAAQVDELLGEVQAADAEDAPRVVVHGDLYDSQLLVREGEVVGVVDVDGAGLGHPADDVANLLAHLHVLTAVAAPEAGVHGWLPAVAAEAAARHDPDQLRRRTTAVLLGLATWPHSRREQGWQVRVQELLDLASRVLREGP